MVDPGRILATALLWCVFAGQMKAVDDLPPIPPTPKKPVYDEYQGASVTDDYRWLESSSPEVREWSNQQNARARSYLDHVAARPAIVEGLQKLESGASIRFGGLMYRGNMLFAFEVQPPKPHP